MTAAREVRRAGSDHIGPVTRSLTVASAALFGVLGVLLALFPTWSAERFAWPVSTFVVATMGGWSVGNAVVAAISARNRRWSTVFPAMIYLWVFGIGQLTVLVVFRDRLRLDHPVAWLYVASLVVTAVGAVAGVVEVARLRPAWSAPGRPIPVLLRVLTALVVAFAAFLAVVLLFSGAAGAGVFPEPLSPFTAGSFAAFFTAAVISGVPLLVVRTIEPELHLARCVVALSVPILAATALHAGVFDVATRPGQWLYPGAYLVTVLGIGVVLYTYRRSQAEPR